MSLLPSPYLVRLQELKLWQGNYDNLLQNNKSQTSDGVSPLDNWDTKSISPSKSFNELLEKKLAEDHPKEATNKPKQPFLRKGSGLARYKLTLGKKQFASKPKSAINRAIEEKKIDQEERKIDQEDRKIEQEEIEPTPLKVPEVAIKCKATWSKEIQDDKYEEKSDIINKLNELSEESPLFDKVNDNMVDCSNSDHNRSVKELRLFEVLEEKFEHASISSTNSSILKLFCSTPTKKAKVPNNYDANSEVLAKFLQNFKLMAQKNWNENIPESLDTTTSETTVEKWSNTESPFEHCLNCSELQNQIEKMKQETLDITEDNANLCDFVKELEHNYNQVLKQMEHLKKNYQKDKECLQEELVAEKNKFEREKALLDLYLKDSQPPKKDREDVSALKKELIDVKELMKLKDAKNGATQARLRNQIKQLEKEKMEFKSSIEILQKENAKLSASQKVHRSTDTKMLQEINRNLHRLTEETKQLNNPDTINTDKNKSKHQKKLRRKSMGDLKEKIEKELDIQLNKTANIPNSGGKLGKCKKSDEENSVAVEVIYNNKCIHSDLEKQYESAFGLHTGNEAFLKNVNDSKNESSVLSEKRYPDGSQEIKYANGNTKTISPDGKFINVQYVNGDIKQTNFNKNILKYYFMAEDVWLTKYADGIELVEFPNGQKEKKFPDGKIEVTTSDGTELITSPGGAQEINYPDGSKMISKNDEKIIYLPNGQKEIHKKEYKKREYPDGTVKILYPDGTQESRYASGRVRVKDASGNLLLDLYEN